MLVLTGFFLTCSQAVAQSLITVTQSQGFSLADPSGDGATVNLPNFNSSLAPFNYTLTEVDVTLSDVILTGQVTVFNTSTHTVTYTSIGLSGQFALTYTDPNGLPTPTNIVTSTVSVAYPDSTPVLAGTSYTTAVTASAVTGSGGNSTTVLTSPTDLAHYAGDGSATITVYLADILSAGATGNFQHSEAENGTGTGTVILTYIYSPVPEPATTASWMLGIGLLAFIGRRYLPTSRLIPVRV